MRKSIILGLVPAAVVLLILSQGVHSNGGLNEENLKKLSPQDIAELERAFDPNNQTPAEDRHLAIKKLVKLGIIGAILGAPLLAAAALPVKLIGLLLLLKHKIPPINIIPLPPPPPPVYYDEPYQPAYSPPMAPPAYAPQAPPAYAPQAPPAYSPPMAPPVYSPPMAAPAYSPPMAQPMGYRK